MWHFPTKKKQKSCKESDLPRMADLVGDRGLLDLSTNSEVLRCWIPEKGKAALVEISTQTGTVAAKYLREFLVVYLYGMHELLKMQAEKIGLYFVPPVVLNADEPPRVMYSRTRTVECIPGLGKNIVPLKIHLPQRIKEDLQLLADRVGIPLSQFVREILISHFFGQTFWPDRLQKWTKEQEHIATEWEQKLREANIFRYSQDCADEIDGDLVVERL